MSATTQGPTRAVMAGGPPTGGALPGPLFLHNRAFEALAAPFLAAGVLREADVALVDAVAPRWGEDDPRVLLALALAVRAPRAGHVGVDLRTARDRVAAEALGRSTGGDAGLGGEDAVAALRALPWPEDAAGWEEASRASPLVGPYEGPPEGATPFVTQALPGLAAGEAAGTPQARTLLMTRRMAHEQRRVAEALRELATTPPSLAFEEEAIEAQVAALYPPQELSSQSALAARAVCRRRLTLITGGPGTGKTYSIARTLAALLGLHAGARAAVGEDGGAQPLRVALAAPTGKAAVRMREAIVENLRGLTQAPGVAEALEGMTSKTLHSLLGVRRDGGLWRDRARPLEADVIVVDEASMIDLVLMRMLLEAVPPGARLVLLGDPDQLASVEAGTVLADLLDGAQPGGALEGANVPFDHNYRFADAPVVGAVAELVRRAARAGEGRGDGRGVEASEEVRLATALAADLLVGQEPTLPPQALRLSYASQLLEKARGDSVRRVRFVRVEPQGSTAPPLASAVGANPGLSHWALGDGAAWPGALTGCPGDGDTDARAAREGAGEAVSDAVRETALVRRLEAALGGGAALSWERVVDLVALPYLSRRGYVQALLRALQARGAGPGRRGAWSAGEVRPILDALDDYRILAVHRRGPRGVRGLNLALEGRLKGLISRLAGRLAGVGDGGEGTLVRHGHWLGEIILVTRNAYDVDLRNGDVGLVLPSSGRGLSAWFPKGTSDAQELPLARLPPHGQGMAMTVHKSQGSQFRRVALILAARPSALQSRELVYTALTRAQACIDWYGERSVLERALASPIERASGLGELLRGG